MNPIAPVILAIATIVIAPSLAQAQPPAARFSTELEVRSTEGHQPLTWSVAAGDETAWEYELQQSRSADFAPTRTIYRGPDRASFVSGLDNGRTWFRVRAVGADGEAGRWSEPLVVEVSYASQAEVLRLLLLGLVVLAATVAVILVGHFRSRRVSS